jgi:hypothetical protein
VTSRVIVSPSSIAMETTPHTLATLETPSIANGEWKRHEDSEVGNGQAEKGRKVARNMPRRRQLSTATQPRLTATT